MYYTNIAFIGTLYSHYDRDKLEDVYSNNKYSIQMIQKSLSGILDIKEFLKIVIFDALIGNSDRHHSNWGVIAKKNILKTKEGIYDVFFEYSRCPLYDNGSSLCAYVNEEDIEQILKDKMRFEALVNTKSKSAIGWENKRPLKHFEMIQKIKMNYYEKTIDYVKIIKEKVNKENIEKLLNEFEDNVITKDMKKLLLKFLIERRNRILEIYDLKNKE